MHLCRAQVLNELEKIQTWNTAIIATVHRLVQQRKRRMHRWWVHAILQRRNEYGLYSHLVRELELDSEKFHGYFRMSQHQFGIVLNLVEQRIAKYSLCREVVCPKQRLAVCLR